MQFSQRGTTSPVRGRIAGVNLISLSLRLGLLKSSSLAALNSAQRPRVLPHAVLIPKPPSLSAYACSCKNVKTGTDHVFASQKTWSVPVTSRQRQTPPDGYGALYDMEWVIGKIIRPILGIFYSCPVEAFSVANPLLSPSQAPQKQQTFITPRKSPTHFTNPI